MSSCTHLFSELTQFCLAEELENTRKDKVSATQAMIQINSLCINPKTSSKIFFRAAMFLHSHNNFTAVTALSLQQSSLFELLTPAARDKMNKIQLNIQEFTSGQADLATQHFAGAVFAGQKKLYSSTCQVSAQFHGIQSTSLSFFNSK